MQELILTYNILPTNLKVNGSVIIDLLCNSITLINTGDAPALVNGSIPLNGGTIGTSNGESISFGGNKGELFKGRLDIAFPLGTGVQNVLILQKVYLPGQNISS
jgi:hypothetical protein